MKFYNRYYKNNYEELLTYYPRFYRSVYEMVEILKAHGRILDELEGHIEQTFFNCFIRTADATTIKKWENMLGIQYEENLTLDQRRSVVIGRISGYGHIGEPEIRGIISNYTENAVLIDFELGVIYITIEGEIFGESNLLDTLLRRIPAHLALNMYIHTERTFRQDLYMNYGSAIGADFTPPLIGEDRTVVGPLELAQGSVATVGLQGIPPDTKHASKRRTEGVGGMFYHTHIKSRLIE